MLFQGFRGCRAYLCYRGVRGLFVWATRGATETGDVWGIGGGEGLLEGQEQDWMGCLERSLSVFKLPSEQKQWALAAKRSGKWFRRVEEAVEQ